MTRHARPLRLPSLALLLVLAAHAAPVAAAPPEPGRFVGYVLDARGEPETERSAWVLFLEPGLAGELCPARIIGFHKKATGGWEPSLDLTGHYSRSINRLLCSCSLLPDSNRQGLWIRAAWTGEAFAGEISGEGDVGTARIVFAPRKKPAAPSGKVQLEDLPPVSATTDNAVQLRFAYTYEAPGPQDAPVVTEQVTIKALNGQAKPLTCRADRALSLRDGKRRLSPTYEVLIGAPGAYELEVQIKVEGSDEVVAKRTTLQVTGEAAQAKAVYTRGEPETKTDGAPDLLEQRGETTLGYAGVGPDGRPITNLVTWTEPPPQLTVGQDFDMLLMATQKAGAEMKANFQSQSIYEPKTDVIGLTVTTATGEGAVCRDGRTFRFRPLAAGGSPKMVLDVTGGVYPWGQRVLTWTYTLSSAPAVGARGHLVDRTPASEYSSPPPVGAPPRRDPVPAVSGEGADTRSDAGSQWAPAQEGKPIPVGGGLRTGPAAIATLALFGGAVAGLGPQTQVSVTAEGLRLSSGQLLVDRPGGASAAPATVVETGAARITGSGTRYAVTHDPARGLTTVVVEEGLVQVTPAREGAQPFTLAAGEQATVVGPAETVPVADGGGDTTPVQPSPGTQPAQPTSGAGQATPAGGQSAETPPYGVIANVSLNRPATQSSLSEWSTPIDPQASADANKASDAAGGCDGVKDGGCGFHTGEELKPWWQVDLGRVYLLDEVRVFNRLGSFAARADSLAVLLSNDGANWSTAYTHNGTPFGGADGNPLSIRLNQALARYVRLQLTTDLPAMLHLDEVEVLGALPAKDAFGILDPGVIAVEPGGPAVEGASFTGRWLTTAGDWGEFVLQQDGTRVTGSYYGGTATLEGTADGRTARLKWSQDNGRFTGGAKFALSNDGQTLDGSRNDSREPIDYDLAQFVWNAKRLDGGAGAQRAMATTGHGFAGRWSTTWGDWGEIVLKQEGNRVTGTWGGTGTLEGTVAGRVLRLKWKNADGALWGGAKFTLSEDGQTMAGSRNDWGEPDQAQFRWDAKRQ